MIFLQLYRLNGLRTRPALEQLRHEPLVADGRSTSSEIHYGCPSIAAAGKVGYSDAGDPGVTTPMRLSISQSWQPRGLRNVTGKFPFCAT